MKYQNLVEGSSETVSGHFLLVDGKIFLLFFDSSGISVGEKYHFSGSSVVSVGEIRSRAQIRARYQGK